MRRLAQELGIEAMSLYTHVRNKDDLLDGMADAVIGEIPVESAGDDWRAALRGTVLAARAVMLRHPWAPRAIASRTAIGPAGLRYVDAILGILRENGFTVAHAHHAIHVLGSRLLGFTQNLFDDSGGDEPGEAAALAERFAASHPYVVELALAVLHDGALGPCDDAAEFTFGLDLILDGLARLRNC
jgi:AcrR family transcriptional regulator